MILIVRCVLWGALGAALARAGVNITETADAAVWVLLVLCTVADAFAALAVYRRGRAEGVLLAVREMYRAGWRKP